MEEPFFLSFFAQSSKDWCQDSLRIAFLGKTGEQKAEEGQASSQYPSLDAAFSHQIQG